MKKTDRAVISRVVLMIIAFLLCSGMRVNANGDDGEKQPAAVLGDRQADGAVYVYVRGMSGSDVTVDSVQIGSERCNDMEIIPPEKGKPLWTFRIFKSLSDSD